MSKYTGTKTEQNLMEAFAGESMARNKYTYFASVAKKAGFEQIVVQRVSRSWRHSSKLNLGRRR